MAQLPFTFRGSPPPSGRSQNPADGPEGPEGNRGAPASAEPSRRPTVRSPASAPERADPLSVQQLCRMMHHRLEQAFPQVAVVGELSRYKRQDSGHAYFTLKDRHARIDCVMWSRHVERLRFRPEEGTTVVCRGRPSVFGRTGRLQLATVHMEPHGVGALHAEFQQRLARLESEGLLASERKRPLPALPACIGLVTSPDGAAIHDVLRTLWAKDPKAHVRLCPTPVQGRGAAARVADAIRRLDRSGACQVLLVVRGGGSLEDLWAFNEEAVVRAIAEAQTPVVCGVGHESDVTLAELVADLRCATPTAAAEAAAPDRRRWMDAWAHLERRMDRAARGQMQRHRHRLRQLESRIPSVDAPLLLRRQHLDEQLDRLHQAVRIRLRHRDKSLTHLERRLAQRAPAVRLAQARARLQQAGQRLEAAMAGHRSRWRSRWALAAGRLEAHSPLKVLARGYAVVQEPGGEVIRSADAVSPGTPLDVQLHRGRLHVRVEDRTPSSETKP